LDENDEEDWRTLHGGMPVEQGNKLAINIWQRKHTALFAASVDERHRWSQPVPDVDPRLL